MFSLNTTIIKPDEDNKINSAVIMLHGYGGDGKDISALTYNWKRFLPNTIFFLNNLKQYLMILLEYDDHNH